jgi:hypothetical protein
MGGRVTERERERERPTQLGSIERASVSHNPVILTIPHTCFIRHPRLLLLALELQNSIFKHFQLSTHFDLSFFLLHWFLLFPILSLYLHYIYYPLFCILFIKEMPLCLFHFSSSLSCRAGFIVRQNLQSSVWTLNICSFVRQCNTFTS